MADKGLYNLLIDIRANVASLQKDMNDAQGVLKRATGGMQSTMRGFFEGLGAELSKGLIREIGNISRAIGNLADEGDKLGAIADNFKALGGSADAIKKAQSAVLGTVDSFELMKAANEGLLRGIPNLNERFADLTKYANQFADATGQDTLPVLNQLIEAFGSGKAEALKKFGFELGETSGKAENTALALEQLTARMGDLGELGVSVTQSQEAFTAAITDARGQIAIAINENEQLAKVYNDIAEAIKQVDWKAVGNDIASMIANIASMLPSLKTVATEIGNISLGLRALTGNMTPMEQNLKKIADLQAELTETQELGKNSFAEWLFDGAYAKKTQELTVELEKAKRAARTLMDNDGMQAFMEGLPSVAPSGGEGNTRAQRNAIAFEKKLAEEKEKGAKKASDKEAKERLKALEDYNDEQMRIQAAAISAEMQKRSALGVEVSEQWGEGIRSALSSAFGVDLPPEFNTFAKKFADTISEAVSGVFGGSSFGDFLDSTISAADAHAKGIQGPAKQDGSFGVTQQQNNTFLGSNLTAQEAHDAGIQGPANKDGSFGPTTNQNAKASSQNYAVYMQAAANAASVFSQNSDDKAQQAKDALNSAGMVIANYWTFGLASVVEALVGRENLEKLSIGVRIIDAIFHEDDGTKARKSFDRWIEKVLDGKGISFINKEGKPQRFTNLETGKFTAGFSDPSWGEKFGKTKNFGMFNALGESFRDLLGITEDVGGQIGYILSTELNDNIDNARRLVKGLGISFEEIEKKLVEVGIRGDKTWLEIETQIQAVGEAFKPGLAAFGDFNSAMSNLLGSGAKGFEAVQSIRDIAIEAGEKGIKSFEQLRAELLKTFDPATVDAFFAALKQRGVTSIAELMKISDRTAGGIVADMQALGVKFTDTGKKIGDSISSNTSSTDANTRALNQNTKALGGKASEDPVDELETDVEMAKGGILTGPTRALMGENGPEAVLPLTRRNGRLGVAMFGNISAAGGGGGYSIHIDARGAALEWRSLSGRHFAIQKKGT